MNQHIDHIAKAQATTTPAHTPHPQQSSPISPRQAQQHTPKQAPVAGNSHDKKYPK